MKIIIFSIILAFIFSFLPHKAAASDFLYYPSDDLIRGRENEFNFKYTNKSRDKVDCIAIGYQDSNIKIQPKDQNSTYYDDWYLRPYNNYDKYPQDLAYQGVAWPRMDYYNHNYEPIYPGQSRDYNMLFDVPANYSQANLPVYIFVIKNYEGKNVIVDKKVVYLSINDVYSQKYVTDNQNKLNYSSDYYSSNRDYYPNFYNDFNRPSQSQGGFNPAEYVRRSNEYNFGNRYQNYNNLPRSGEGIFSRYWHQVIGK